MQEKTKENKFFELLVTIIFTIFSAFMLYIAFKTQKPTNQAIKVIHAMTIPKIVLAAMLIASVYVLIHTISWYYKNRKYGNLFPSFGGLVTKKTFFTLVLVILYACAWKYLGFSISTFIYFAIQSKLVKSEQSIKKTLLVAAAFTIAAYVIFSIGFKMFFPEPILDRILYS